MKPMDEQLCREILEVGPGATTEEINLAYQLLKRIHGQDFVLCGGSAMEEFSPEARQVALEEIEAAYAQLSALGQQEQLRPSAEIVEPSWQGPSAAPMPGPGVALATVPSAAPTPVPELEPAAAVAEAPAPPTPEPSQPEPAPAATTFLGRAREAAGLSLEAVVAETHVPLAYLEAFEAEDFSALPVGTVYVRGFLQAFVRVIGLDADEVVPAYMANYLRWEAAKKTR